MLLYSQGEVSRNSVSVCVYKLESLFYGSKWDERENGHCPEESVLQQTILCPSRCRYLHGQCPERRGQLASPLTQAHRNNIGEEFQRCGFELLH